MVRIKYGLACRYAKVGLVQYGLGYHEKVMRDADVG